MSCPDIRSLYTESPLPRNRRSGCHDIGGARVVTGRLGGGAVLLGSGRGCVGCAGGGEVEGEERKHLFTMARERAENSKGERVYN